VADAVMFRGPPCSGPCSRRSEPAPCGARSDFDKLDTPARTVLIAARPGTGA
jgi:hypothetical protein